MVLVQFLVAPVYASSVTVAPRNPGPIASGNKNPGVTFKTQYGYLNATNTQYYASFTVYANGTIFFDVRGFELSEPDHSLYFMELAYGNGTMAVRVLTNIAPAVYGFTSARSGLVGGASGIELDFTGPANGGALTLTWGAVRTQVLTGAYFVGTLFGILLIFAAVYWLMTRRDLSPKGFAHGVEQIQRTKDKNMLFITVAILAVILIATVFAALYVGT